MWQISFLAWWPVWGKVTQSYYNAQTMWQNVKLMQCTPLRCQILVVPVQIRGTKQQTARVDVEK